MYRIEYRRPARKALMQMEAGRKGGSVPVYRRLADTLGVDMDELLPAGD